jgi:drug/metabolite transporter (DMT)-like permease
VRRVPVPVLFVAVAFCWAMNSVVMREVRQYGPVLSIAAIRGLIGAVVLLVLARRAKADWPRGRQEITGVVLAGLSMTGLSTAFLFLGARRLPAGLVSIFSNTMPLFTAVLAALFLAQPLSARVSVGLLVGMAGTVLVAWRSLHGDVDALGVVYGLSGAFFAAVGAILYKKFPLPRLDRRMSVGCQLVVSTVVLALMSVPDDRSTFHVRPMFFVLLAYLSLIGLALSFVMFSALVSRASVMLSGSVAYLAMVLGVALGALLLHERLSVLEIVGAFVTLIGVALVQFALMRPEPRVQQA